MTIWLKSLAADIARVTLRFYPFYGPVGFSFSIPPTLMDV